MLNFGPFLFEYTQFQSGSTTRVLKREILEDLTWADKGINTSMEEVRLNVISDEAYAA